MCQIEKIEKESSMLMSSSVIMCHMCDYSWVKGMLGAEGGCENCTLDSEDGTSLG